MLLRDGGELAKERKVRGTLLFSIQHHGNQLNIRPTRQETKVAKQDWQI